MLFPAIKKVEGLQQVVFRYLVHVSSPTMQPNDIAHEITAYWVARQSCDLSYSSASMVRTIISNGLHSNLATFRTSSDLRRSVLMVLLPSSRMRCLEILQAHPIL